MQAEVETKPARSHHPMYTRRRTKAEDAFYDEKSQRFYVAPPLGSKRRRKDVGDGEEEPTESKVPRGDAHDDPMSMDVDP